MNVLERYVYDAKSPTLVVDTQTGQKMTVRAVLAGLNLCEHLSREPDQLAGAVELLREIAARSPLGTSSEARVIAMARKWVRDHDGGR